MNEPKCYISDIELICIRKQGDLMDINRSTIYYNAIPENEENHRIMRLMDEEFLEHPTDGVIQMQDFLFSLNFLVNNKRIPRLLRKMGFMALYLKCTLSTLCHAKYIRPDVFRGLQVLRPNQV